MSGSEWTQLLLKHGYAVSADEIERGDAVAGPPGAPRSTLSQTPEPAPTEGLSARVPRVRSAKASQAPLTPERRLSLEDWAYKFTGKRTRKR